MEFAAVRGGGYAALKRRSSTVVLAAVVVLRFGRDVKGDGQECPSYTGSSGAEARFFFQFCSARLEAVPFPIIQSFKALRQPKTGISASVVEMPCKADDGVQRSHPASLRASLRLRMTSTSWASCFAQDDRSIISS
jgi:hypothetical protein